MDIFKKVGFHVDEVGKTEGELKILCKRVIGDSLETVKVVK